MKNIGMYILAVSAAISVIACNPYPDPTAPPSDVPPAGDSTLSDAASCLHVYDRICYDFPVPSQTDVVPQTGHFVVQPADPSTTVEPLDKFGFDVVTDKYHADPFINFTVDSFRYDKLNLSHGAFSIIHGASFDGTYFPSDGYTVAGSFVSPTEARGYFQYMPMLVRHTAANFIATLVP